MHFIPGHSEYNLPPVNNQHPRVTCHQPIGESSFGRRDTERLRHSNQVGD